MKQTDNHGYNKPGKGETEWHIPLNDNFALIDNDVEIRDAESNLTNYSPKSGAKFLATDTQSTFVGDGNNWNRLTTREMDGRVGALVIDKAGNYRAISFLTDETWTDPSDAGVVLQSLADALSATGSENLGEVAVGHGVFNFETTVVLNEHMGLGLVGQSMKQTNKGSPTIFRNSGISPGRGIIEYGNIGSTSDIGQAHGSYIEKIMFDGNDADVFPIYVWGQDRIRLSDVKADHIGPGGHGIIYIGSYNSTWKSVYANQGAVLNNVAINKNTNSFRLRDTTFNTDNPSVPPAIIEGGGCYFEQVLFNSLDVVDGLDGGFVLSGDASKAVVQDTDPRVDRSDIGARIKRINFSNCGFVGDRAGNDSLVDNPFDVQFTSCVFVNGAHAAVNPQDTTITSCTFKDQTRQSIWFESDSKKDTTVVSNIFKNVGTDGTAAIGSKTKAGNLPGLTISSNTFKQIGGTYDIDFAEKTSGYSVIGNSLENGVSDFEGGPIDFPETRLPLVISNKGYNPVGFRRDTPTLPSGTGSGSSVGNSHNQGVWVYQEGAGGTTIFHADGTEHSLSTDPSTVFVPRHGGIYYESSVPENWDWWWV